MLIIVIADAGQFSDPDLWGHLRFGQAALAQGHLIWTDPYSYSVPGHLWRNHEWLTEIVMALSYGAFGVAGLKLWKFACAAAAISFIAAGLAETEAEPEIQLYTLIAAAVPLMLQMEFRPQIFTFALFAAVLAILARHNYRGEAPLWPLPPMLALWANLHGGFIMGIAALGIYTAITAVRDFTRGRGLGRATRLGSVTIASTLATLITPYGLDTWRTVAHALANPLTRRVVNDWRPLLHAMRHQLATSYSGETFYLFALAIMAAAVIGVLMSPDGGDLPLAAIAFTMIAAAFVAVRNMPLAVIACTLPVARHGSIIARRYARKPAAPEAPPAARAHIGFYAYLIAAAALALTGGIFSPRIRTDNSYPAGALAFMRAHRIEGNLLNDFNWGEYLIWRAPESKVFIDGRYDTVYPLKVIRDYLSFYFDAPGAAKVLASYPHDLALIPPSSGAFRLLARAPGWTLIYHDKDSALFARSTSAAARMRGIPVIGAASAPRDFP